MKKDSFQRTRILIAMCAATALAPGFALAQQTTPRTDSPTTPATALQTTEQTGEHVEMTAETFARAAALGGLKEVHVGQLAMQKTQSSEVRQLASRIVEDHSAANQRLMLLARTRGIDLPPTNVFEKIGAEDSDRLPVRGTEEDAATGTGDPRARLERQRDEARDVTRSDSTALGIERQPGELAALRGSADASKDARLEQMKQECIQDVERLQGLSGSEFDREFVKAMVKDHEMAVQKFEQAAQSLEDRELKNFASDTLPKLRQHLEMAQELQKSLGENAGG